MKNSGVEWIGEIPEEWEISKTKYLTKLYTGNSIKDEEKDLYEDKADAIPYISSKDINATFSTTNYENGMYVKHSDNSFVRAPAGSTLMCIEGGSAGKKKTFLNQEVCFVNKLCCFSPIKIDNKFLFYCLNSPNYEEEFRFNISGMIGGVSVGKLNQFILPKPPKETQQCIASYLDKKCNKIEETIQNQQQVIEKLKAYKQSLITEAVTGKVKIENGKICGEYESYKDSGVEWIGKIPSGWTKQKLKFASQIMRGLFSHRPRNDPDYYDGVHPFIQTGEVARAVKYITTYSQTLNELGFSVSREFPAGTVLLTIAANVGDVAILDFNACFPDSVIGFYPKDNVSKVFLYYLLKSMKEQFMKNAIISTQMNLNINIVKEEFIPLPSLAEQKEIVKFLEKKSDYIDTAIEQKQNLIEKLTEYKKSLIYECVTGKKEI